MSCCDGWNGLLPRLRGPYNSKMRSFTWTALALAMRARAQSTTQNGLPWLPVTTVTVTSTTSVSTATVTTTSTFTSTATVTVSPSGSSTSTSTTSSDPSVVTNQAYIDTVLRHHNYHRQNHSSPALVWDSGLADIARQITTQCVFEMNLYVQPDLFFAPSNPISILTFMPFTEQWIVLPKIVMAKAQLQVIPPQKWVDWSPKDFTTLKQILIPTTAMNQMSTRTHLGDISHKSCGSLRFRWVATRQTVPRMDWNSRRAMGMAFPTTLLSAITKVLVSSILLLANNSTSWGMQRWSIDGLTYVQVTTMAISPRMCFHQSDFPPSLVVMNAEPMTTVWME